MEREKRWFSSPPKPTTTLATTDPSCKEISSKPPLHVTSLEYFSKKRVGEWKENQKTWREEEVRGPAGTIEEWEKNQKGEEENHQNLAQILSKNHVVRVTSLPYLLF